jgi:hypothetical protein
MSHLKKTILVSVDPSVTEVELGEKAKQEGVAELENLYSSRPTVSVSAREAHKFSSSKGQEMVETRFEQTQSMRVEAVKDIVDTVKEQGEEEAAVDDELDAKFYGLGSSDSLFYSNLYDGTDWGEAVPILTKGQLEEVEEPEREVLFTVNAEVSR